MTIENQVCTLEQAKRLKELGINQESLFSWFGDEQKRLMDNGRDGVIYGPWIFLKETEPCNNMEADWRVDVAIKEPIAAAFTVAELGVMLPNDLFEKYKEYGGVAFLKPAYKAIDWADGSEIIYLPEAQSRTDLLIHLLSTNQITAAECNERLMAA